MEKCELCNSMNATIKCSKCCQVAYCCKEHLEKHWEVHRSNCHPYVIGHTTVLGRYLATSRDIKAGELLHREIPVAIGPQPGSPPACLGCLRQVFRVSSGTGYFHCSTCHIAPFCSSECSMNEWHSTLECSALASQNSKRNALKPIALHSQTILPLRCFLLQWINPKQWKSLMDLEGHLEIRKETSVWRSVDEGIVNLLIDTGLISSEDRDTLQKICAILDVNSFEVRGPDGNPLRAIYPTSALLAHDCLPSTCIAHEPGSMALVIRSAISLKPGELITHNYAGTLISTLERRESLLKGKYFECVCRRCKDPFEFGTNLGSLKCCSCNEGPVVSKNPIDRKSNWGCEKCGYEISGTLASLTLSVARTKLSESNQADAETMELLLENFQRSFYPGHAILLEVGQILAGLYNVNAPHWEMSFRQTYPLHRRWKLCKELLHTLNKLEPGISRMKGVCMYEMATSTILLATKVLEADELDSKDVVLILKQSEMLIQQSISHLLYEPAGSPEQKLIYSALRSLRKVKEMLSSFSKEN